MKKSIAIIALGITTLLAPSTASADDCRYSSRRYVSTRTYVVPQVRYYAPVHHYSSPRCATRHIVYESPRYDYYGRRIVSYPGISVGGYIRIR